MQRSGKDMRKSHLLLAVLTLCLVACTAGPNPLAATPDAHGAVAGFWSGLWHGLIFPFTFLGSLFMSNISIYEVHNNGGWYNFGYLLGAIASLGGGARTTVIYRKQSSNTQRSGNTYDG
jgi:hypothetical protein